MVTTLIDEYNGKQINSTDFDGTRICKKGKDRGSGSSKASANVSSEKKKDGSTSDDHNRNKSMRRAYTSNSNSYDGTFCDSECHTTDLFHINLDNPDHHLLKILLE